MKRVLALFTSEPGKRSKPSSPERVMAYLDSVERVQAELLELDIASSKEQLQVQRRYDSLRQPLLEQRRADIAKIPDFWFSAIRNHPSSDAYVFDSIDSAPLAYLIHLDLHDNIDDHGSYRIVFEFIPNPYFSESCLERTVNFFPDMLITATPIRWAPHQRPRSDPRSLFSWFSNTESEYEETDWGEIFRQDLWQNPFAYYCKHSVNSKATPSPEEEIEIQEST